MPEDAYLDEFLGSIFGVVLCVQLWTGHTFGADLFRTNGGESIPAARWPRWIKRSDEPAFYWTQMGMQILLILFLLLTRHLKQPRFDVNEMTQKGLANGLRKPAIRSDSE